jgi:hypothetical protein
MSLNLDLSDIFSMTILKFRYGERYSHDLKLFINYLLDAKGNG